MNITRICTILIVSLLLVSTFSAFNPIFGVNDPSSPDVANTKSQSWLSENVPETSFLMYGLTAQIWVTVKNSEDHVQYFKISENYQGSLSDSGNDSNSIHWAIRGTKPTAVKMVKTSVKHSDPDDYGWAIPADSKKSVYFKLKATFPMGSGYYPSATYIAPAESEQDNGTYWPLQNEPGLWFSWFSPDELHVLNPSLDVVSWTGKFNFKVRNKAEQKVSGIVRAPIVPVDSELIAQSPSKGKFIDDESALSTQTAAWDVTLGANKEQSFSYTYKYPYKKDQVGPEKKSTKVKTENKAKKNTKVPTQKTGLPLGLLAIGALAAVGGVGYARFKK